MGVIGNVLASSAVDREFESLLLLISGEAANTNIKVFGLIRPRLERTFYHTRLEHTNHQTTDVVGVLYVCKIKWNRMIK